MNETARSYAPIGAGTTHVGAERFIRGDASKKLVEQGQLLQLDQRP